MLFIILVLRVYHRHFIGQALDYSPHLPFSAVGLILIRDRLDNKQNYNIMSKDKCKCGRPKSADHEQCQSCIRENWATRTHKICNGCGKDLPLDKFGKRKKGNNPRSQCKECNTKEAIVWRKSNPAKVKRGNRRRCWRNRYGLDPDKVEKFLSTHNGNCDICGIPANGQAHAVDHCHKSGKFRGILCSNCNNGLGRFMDNPALLLRAAEYLNKIPLF